MGNKDKTSQTVVMDDPKVGGPRKDVLTMKWFVPPDVLFAQLVEHAEVHLGADLSLYERLIAASREMKRDLIREACLTALREHREKRPADWDWDGAEAIVKLFEDKLAEATGQILYNNNGSTNGATRKMIEGETPVETQSEQVTEPVGLQWLDNFLQNWDNLTDDKKIEAIERIENSPLTGLLRERFAFNNEPKQTNSIIEPRITDEWLDPNVVAEDFDRVINFLNENSRRPPVRVQRIWRAFQHRENDIVNVEDITKQFKTENPESDARTAITWLNRTFEKFGIDLEIQHIPAYRLKRRSIT